MDVNSEINIGYIDLAANGQATDRSSASIVLMLLMRSPLAVDLSRRPLLQW